MEFVRCAVCVALWNGDTDNEKCWHQDGRGGWTMNVVQDNKDMNQENYKL